MFAAHLTGARVVKAFNAILVADIIEHARPSGTPHRRAIPIAGDDDDEASRRRIHRPDRLRRRRRRITGRRSKYRSDGCWGPVLDADALRAAKAARKQHRLRVWQRRTD
jgi:hypothetical protein